MNEAMQTKQEIIENLYAIRAGLSYISKLADKNVELQGDIYSLSGKQQDEVNNIKQINDSIAQLRMNNPENELVDLQEQIVKEEKFISDSLTEIAERKNELDAYIKQGDSVEEKEPPARYERSRKFFYFILLSIGLIIGSIEGIVHSKASDYRTTIMVISILFLIGASIFLIYSFVRFAKQTADNVQAQKRFEATKGTESDYFRKNVEKKKKIITKLESKVEEARKQVLIVKERIDDIPTIEKKHNAKLKKLDESIQECEQRIASCNKVILDIQQQQKENIKNGEAVHQSLISLYGDFCHIDNWQHIDRILYYLVTGRADNLRDALNLMDQRLNAEMIAREIRTASETVCGEIKRMGNSLMETMILSAERLRDSIQQSREMIIGSIYKTGAAVVDGMGVVANEMVDLNAKMEKANALAETRQADIKKLITANELTNALQEKSNRTMEQLLRDYEYMNRDEGVHQSI